MVSPSSSRKKSPKKKTRCTHEVDGKRCKLNQPVDGVWFCNKHLNKIFNLQIKPSGIKGAGMGLFCGSHPFKKDDIVGEYSRYDIKKSPKETYKNCNTHECQAYIYCSDAEECWDAKNTPSIIVRFANDARSERKNNACFEDYKRRVFMYTDKNIKAGNEIFCDYGEDYDWSFLEH